MSASGSLLIFSRSRSRRGRERGRAARTVSAGFLAAAIVCPGLSARGGFDDPSASAAARPGFLRMFARKILLLEGSPNLKIAGYAGENYPAAKRLNPVPASFRPFPRCRKWFHP